jgi:hypothetical protein
LTHERIRKSGECLLCDQLCEWGIKMGGWSVCFGGASREARGPGGVIANEGEAIQLMFGCSCDCTTRVLNQPARPSPDTSWIASLSLAMTVDDWVSFRSDAFHNLASPVMELACALCV